MCLLVLSLVNRHVFWLSTTLLNMRNGKDVWCNDLVAIHGCCLVKLNWFACWFGTVQSCQLTLWNPIRHFCCYFANVTYMLAGPEPLRVESCLICRCSCNKYTCWPSATATSTLLFKHAYWLSAAARWTLVGPLVLNQHACRYVATQTCMPTGVVLLYMSYLLVWCLTISRACWRSA